MISRIRNSIFSKVLWGLMGLYLLNISVDSADPNPEYVPEDLSFNDQESIIEMIIEQVLGYEDAIKEYDDYDTEDHHKKRNIKIDFLDLHSKTNHDNHHLLGNQKQRYPNYKTQLTNGFAKIDSPPPKV